MQLRIERELPALPPQLDAVVGAYWEVALRTRPLFNGPVFCADRLTPDCIFGHWTEYRRLLAQIAEPGLFSQLGVRALAVCGAVCTPDGVVVARREPRSVYQPGMWQLPPAGSVDQAAAVPGGADWRTALLQELDEELGLTEADTTRLRPLCLVQHPSGVLDLGVQIDTVLGVSDIKAAQAGARHQEYDRVLVAPAGELAQAVRAAGGVLVPSAQYFLDRLAL